MTEKMDPMTGWLFVVAGAFTAHCALMFYMAVAPACSGLTVRDEGLLPLTVIQYQEIVMPLALDGAMGDEKQVADVEAFLTVLQAGDRGGIDFFHWVRIQLLADLGIQLRLEREEIGPNGATVLYESVRRMDENISRLLAR